jgi:hypothetical protein
MNTDLGAVIGVVLVLLIAGVIVFWATAQFRKSNALAAAALSADASSHVELICGVRIGQLNCTWPGGRLLLDGEGITFKCLGVAERASWRDIREAELVKPLNLVGWGVRFRLSDRQRSAIVWLTSRPLALRLLEACRTHGLTPNVGWRFVL